MSISTHLYINVHYCVHLLSALVTQMYINIALVTCVFFNVYSLPHSLYCVPYNAHLLSCSLHVSTLQCAFVIALVTYAHYMCLYYKVLSLLLSLHMLITCVYITKCFRYCTRYICSLHVSTLQCAFVIALVTYAYIIMCTHYRTHYMWVHYKCALVIFIPSVTCNVEQMSPLQDHL